MASIAQPRSVVRGDDRFFVTSAIVMALLIVAGFSLQLAMGRSSFSAPVLVHVHAIVFMGWVVLYLLQAASGAGGGRALHRTLGWIGAGWTLLMVVLGTTATVAMVRRGQSPFFFRPAEFLVFNPLSVLTFAGLTGAAIALRRRTAWHRRLHFCGMAMLTGPAFGRLLPMPLLIPHAFEVTLAATLALPAAGIVADLRRTGRVHPAWGWGIGAMLAFAVMVEFAVSTGPAAALHRAVTAGTPGAAVDPLGFPPPPGPPPALSPAPPDAGR